MKPISLVASALLMLCCVVILYVPPPQAGAATPTKAGAAKATSAKAAQDAIGLPGPLRFGNQTFALAWASHPSPQLYKQEYLPAGETVERYSSMLMVDVIPSGSTVKDMARDRVAKLNARKTSDPVVNYQLITNPAGEIILDFVMSAEGADGNTIVEWNAYRYSQQGSGVRLVAISRRAYGAQVDSFLRAELRSLRTRDIATLSKLSLPPVKLARP